jgi:WD40 repeat protein
LSRSLWSIDFTADGRSFWAAGSPQTAIWRVGLEGRAGGNPAAPALEFFRTMPDTYDACLSPDGRRLASSTKGRLDVFDVADLRPVFSVPYDHPGGARHLAFSPDGTRLVSINRRYEIEVWDIATGRKSTTLGGDPARSSSSTIALGHGGDSLADANGSITIWDLTHSSPAIVLPETRKSIWSMTWIPGQDRLAVGTSDGELVT